MENVYVTYFEVTYKNTIARYTSLSPTHYSKRLAALEQQYPDLELVYREWSDGTVEDGVIERENWYI